MEKEWPRRRRAVTERIFNNVFGVPELNLHDVFISFRGEDTRRNFVSYLHATLVNAGIKVFIDDKELQRGQEISVSLRQAIVDSRISIVVFSTNYAGSRWCLEELVDIMVCHKGDGRSQVLPVFLSVDPFEVRYQGGTFGQAFENLVNRRSVIDDDARAWREALTEAANLSGFHFSNYREQKLLKDLH
ncbi:hypothetical protein L6164_033351 [Bauhinia variegata]|uniref:Uncharacterized protein n=1 Tax=Bauhinia variegata TaxID=167791 RepID=A0ACB9KRQ2_BAUVA|nr:hypothetical protein L6164_033351 [Bauhinia variegata]